MSQDDVEKKDQFTPLMLACEHGKSGHLCITLLAHARADLTAVEGRGPEIDRMLHLHRQMQEMDPSEQEELRAMVGQSMGFSGQPAVAEDSDAIEEIDAKLSRCGFCGYFSRESQ